MTKSAIIYDVAVIGGGPAGMMAAGRAAECGAKVVLLEKNHDLGKKLLLTGGGRCNLTNHETDLRRFLARFKDRQKFLFSPFSKFGVKETLDFFNSRGLATKVEAENRVFPVSNSAQSVLDVMLDYLRAGQVRVRTGATVAGFISDGEKISGLKIGGGDGKARSGKAGDEKIIRAHSYILATGGKSRPDTGSTGEGFDWLRIIGHNVLDSDAALVPIKTAEPWVKRLAGVSLKDVKLTVYQNHKKQATGLGKMLFTHFGISGPLVLNLSRRIGALLKHGSVELTLDLRPELEEIALNEQLQEFRRARPNKKLRNILSGAVPAALAPVLIELAGLDPTKAVNFLARGERLALVRLMKHLPLTATGLMGLDKAVVTSGGADLQEIDWKNMRSRLYPNLFMIGDVLNIDRPSGGYSLQLCWTTGYVAGTAAAKK
jgi:predicted Rossmann fold flavoprotein